jgi:hypothetical protein
MKCQKCGFVSFDYLSECRACGADLNTVRQRLGFSALKSEVPFLLGTLLKGGGKSESRQEWGDEEAGDFDLGTSSGLGSGHLPSLQPIPEKPRPVSTDALELVDRAEDELLIELSEDDFEALTEIRKTPKIKEPPKDQ